MNGPRAAVLQVSPAKRELLRHLPRQQTADPRRVRRASLILALAANPCVEAVARQWGLTRVTVRHRRDRWLEATADLQRAEQDQTPAQLRTLLEHVLDDAPRPGTPAPFSPEQIVRIGAVACEPPEESARPISHWTRRELADEVKRRGIVPTISPRSVGRFLEEAELQPHRSRYGLNTHPNGPEVFRQQAAAVCALYEQAGRWAEQGIPVISTDEKTGIPALERLSPDILAGPGWVQRREFAYTRHGTLCLTANLKIWCGGIITPTLGPTRTEAGFVAHVEQTVATDSAASWVFILDTRNTHQSESLVLWVAQTCGIEENLGVKGKSGVLKSLKSRATFLSEEGHRIRFVSTPKHTSWLNQIELGFGILVRKLLRRSRFSSIENLKARILGFIDYFNRTMAKPIRWLYSAEPKLVTGTG